MSKLIVSKGDNIVRWRFSDSAVVVQEEYGTSVVDNDDALGIGDMNINNSVVINVPDDEVPADFVGCRYTYLDGVFELNPECAETE